MNIPLIIKDIEGVIFVYDMMIYDKISYLSLIVKCKRKLLIGLVYE